MGKLFLLFSLAGVLFCCNSLQGQTTVSLNPAKDNTLYEDATGSLSNGAGDHFFVGLNNLNFRRRGLIMFDIASIVPAGATIVSASLTLTMDQTNSGPSIVDMHVASADWGEGASVAAGSGGSGATAQSNDATWLHNFYSDSFWNSAGGDFNTTVSASATVNGTGVYNWNAPQLMVDVQKWLDTPTSNFGWCLIGNETTKQSAMRFASKEIANATSRPTLTIVYTVPVGIREANSGLRYTIYPNPSPGKLHMTVDDVPKATVKIFNAMGSVVYFQQLNANQQAIDLSMEPEGVYFYKLLSKDQIVETGKIIIKK